MNNYQLMKKMNITPQDLTRETLAAIGKLPKVSGTSSRSDALYVSSDVEKVLDEVIFLKNGQLVCYDTVDRIRETQGKSVDALFREIFRTVPVQEGGYQPWGN